MRRRFFASKSSDIYGFMYYYQDGTVDNKYINKPLNGILIGPFQASGVNQYFVLSHDFEYVTMLGDAYQIKYTSMCLYDKDVEFKFEGDFNYSKVLLSNYNDSSKMIEKLKLRPYEAVMYRFN